ncbi:MAG: restriction endonuclease [Sulfurimonas sp.]|nr:restriction endonuclease [Sulfurimonas sp.]
MDDYYLVKQVIRSNLKRSFKIYCPLNIAHLKTLLDNLPGNLYVYIVNAKDNSTKNLTNELGKTDFNYSSFLLENTKIYQARFRFSLGQSSWIGDDIHFYTIIDPSRYFPKQFFCCGSVTFPHTTWLSRVELTESEQQQSRVYAGEEYEKFVGKKYESAGYIVDYRGLNLGKKDGGLDLIAENATSIVFVQCKNWIETDNYQIESRDLRAFIGDCYLFLLQNTIDKRLAFHYIISDNEMLSESAKYFINRYKMLKVKEIKFNH